MPKFSCVRCVRMLVELLGMLHISLVSLYNILSNFLMTGLEKGTAICVCYTWLYGRVEDLDFLLKASGG